MRASIARSLAWFSVAFLVGACGKKDAPAPTDGGAAAPATGPGSRPAEVAPGEPAGLLAKSPADDWATGNGMVKVLVHHAEARAAGGETQLVTELDVLDVDSGRPVSLLDAESIAVTLDGKYLPGKYAVSTFRDAGRGVALALLLPAHQSYATGPDAADGLEINPLQEVKRGATALLQKLTENDRVAVFGLTEEGVKALAPWGPPSAAVAHVAELAPLADRQLVPPPLYATLEKVLGSLVEASADLPARRVILTVSDGVDATGDKASVVDRRIGAITERALAPEVGAEIWALGFTLGEDAPLVTLETLVSKVGGRYRRQPVDAQKDLAQAFEDLGSEAAGGFVVTVTAAPGVRLPVISTLELAVRLPTSGAIGRGRVEGVRAPPVP